MNFFDRDAWSGIHGRSVLPGGRRRPVFLWVRCFLGKGFGGLGSETGNEVFHHRWDSPQRTCSYQRIEILPNQIRYGISFSFSWSILNAICNCRSGSALFKRSGSALFKKPPPGGSASKPQIWNEICADKQISQPSISQQKPSTTSQMESRLLFDLWASKIPRPSSVVLEGRFQQETEMNCRWDGADLLCTDLLSLLAE